jgi:hypothetical protein
LPDQTLVSSAKLKFRTDRDGPLIKDAIDSIYNIRQEGSTTVASGRGGKCVIEGFRLLKDARPTALGFRTIHVNHPDDYGYQVHAHAHNVQNVRD